MTAAVAGRGAAWSSAPAPPARSAWQFGHLVAEYVASCEAAALSPTGPVRRDALVALLAGGGAELNCMDADTTSPTVVISSDAVAPVTGPSSIGDRLLGIGDRLRVRGRHRRERQPVGRPGESGRSRRRQGRAVLGSDTAPTSIAGSLRGQNRGSAAGSAVNSDTHRSRTTSAVIRATPAIRASLVDPESPVRGPAVAPAIWAAPVCGEGAGVAVRAVSVMKRA